MEDFKSIHVVTYICSYDGTLKSIKNTHLDKEVDVNDVVYFDGFQKLFTDQNMINTIVFDHLKNKNNELIKVNESICELKVNEEYSIMLNVNAVKIYNAPKLKLFALELILINYESEDFINISRNIDKNIKFSKFDEFKGIFLNGLELIAPTFDQRLNNENINNIFFDNSVNNLKVMLGRKNYQVISIISDRLSSKAKNIYRNEDLEIFKIATSDDAPHELGAKNFEHFLTCVYDKWIHTGSVYVINNVNTTQILSSNQKAYVEQMIYTYNKMVIISLFQKATFIEFQNVDQKNSQLKHFNYFINKYYFMEVSQEHQVQIIYEMLQGQLKNDEYYEILKDEIEIYRSTSNMRLMLSVTVFYTVMSLLTVILMLIFR